MVASPPSWRKSPAAFLEPVVDRLVENSAQTYPAIVNTKRVH